MPEVAFLSADQALTKIYRKTASGIQKTAYPIVDAFTSHLEKVSNIEDLYSAIKVHAAQGHCLLKGKLNRPLRNESRAGSTDTNDATEWVCLDIDGLEVDGPDELMLALGLSAVSYVVQYSASYKITDDRLRCHIFFMLDQPTSAPLLKQWLMDLNFNTELVNGQLSLSPSNNFISWPIDVTTCQNDKLLYIAAPTLVGIKDPIKERVQLVKKKAAVHKIVDRISSVSANRARIDVVLNELREEAGLPKRKAAKYSQAGQLEYQANPDQGVVTGTKIDRGFVYLNLNGGDSWGYYHPDDKFDYVYNFKGEPTYRTKDLIPEYYYDRVREQEEQEEAGEVLMHLAFRDFHSAKYYNGWYDPVTRDLNLAMAASEKQLGDYMASRGRAAPDRIPIMCLEFHPEESWTINRDGEFPIINTYVPSVYMLNEEPKRPPKIPTLINRVIRHTLADDDAAVEHFLNWLACIVQFKVNTGTAWLLGGTTGTGKGTLCNRIITPLIGGDYVMQRRMDEMQDKFNGWMEKAIVVFVDEIEQNGVTDSEELMRRFKTLITEDTVSIRAMQREARNVPNHTNWVFSTNKRDALKISPDDRRINVAPWQSNKLILTPQEYEEGIPAELGMFADYLRTRKADRQQARTVLLTDQRAELIFTSSSSIELACQAVTEGNLQFFLDELPDDDRFTNAAAMMKMAMFKKVLSDIVENPNRPYISRDALMVLFDFVLSDNPRSSHKFTSTVKHYGLMVKPCRVEGETVRGFPVEWQIPETAAKRLGLNKADAKPSGIAQLRASKPGKKVSA